MQQELDIPLELFTPGPDDGIDIRHIGAVDGVRRTLIAQCKRWDESSFDELLRHLTKDELPKIQKLAPERYILMTSVRLTPGRKGKIVTALDPWIRAPSDVIGRDDISGLLARHNEIERRHIKLWLTSTEVFDALLNSDIVTRSEGALEHAKRQLRLWVPNPSFERALEVLDEAHVCVISGAPGIGKTMLADVLLARYASAGYESVVISSDIAEAERLWRSDRRQVFYYDDFLGHVTYGELQLEKNEESRLANFIERVQDSKNKRFILTTREYILAEARLRYERLSDMAFDAYNSIVSLDDYTQLIRAQILYNHLFFSDLPSNLKAALVIGRRYWDVIRHRNYNPRVISHAVSLPGVGELTERDFVSNMIRTLENPTGVWDRIFDNLPAMARRILLAVASLPTAVRLEDVEAAVRKLTQDVLDPGEFRSALGMLEGAFLEIKRPTQSLHRRERVVTIRDPSVLDYLWARLDVVDGEAELLLENAAFFEQCVILYQGGQHMRPASGRGQARVLQGAQRRAVVHHEQVARKALDLIASPSLRLDQVRTEGLDEGPPLELRAAFLATMLAEHPSSPAVAASAAASLEAASAGWAVGRGYAREGVSLLRRAKVVETMLPGDVLAQAQSALLRLISDRLDQTEGFTALVNLADLAPHLFSQPHRELTSWATEFRAFLAVEEWWLLHDLDDPDWIDEDLRAIQAVADALRVDIAELVEQAELRSFELREEAPPELDDDGWRESDWASGSESSETEIDALFQSLL